MTGKKTLPFDKVSDRLTYALRFKKLANAIHAAPDFRTVLIGLREDILHLYEAQMATIYLVDKKEIYSLSMTPDNRLREIRLPISSASIAGHVARTGKLVNIRNVYDPAELLSIDPDLTFDASWDQKTGIRTRQVLAVPVLFENVLLGVIQLMNKQGGARFTVEDEKCLYDLAETLGIAFHNLNRSALKRIPSRYDALIASGSISEQELAEARELARRRHKDMETILLHELKVSRQELGNSLARFYNTAFVDLRQADYNPVELFHGINIEYFHKARCVPLARKDGIVIFAIDDPHDQAKAREIMQVLRAAKAEFHVALREDIEYFIGRHGSQASGQQGRGHQRSPAEIVAEMQKEEKSAPAAGNGDLPEQPADDRAIVMLVRKIVEDAFRQRASDIHFEPYGREQDSMVRFRIDGRCVKALSIPSSHIRSVISRLKIMARLDIAERRRPQDGKIRLRVASGREIELRVCTIPTADGHEDVVLRLLATSEPLPLAKLMQLELSQRFSEIINKPHGLILVVGPTGSGKTTTLHSALGLLNSADRKILTAEDPVEITQYGLRQVQVNPKIGLSFAAAMRAFLRADPDVIMVGEMRDRETAAIAIEASLTGHLVLSTLHTNSAPETIIRLKDMGLDPFSFADSLLGILAQRLVRTLCRQCKTAYLPARNEYDHLAGAYGPGFEKITGMVYSERLRIYKADGCSSCNNQGYRGRSGLYELLLASRPMKRLMIDGAGMEAIRELAVAEGMTTLLQDGIRNVFAGRTDFSQVMSACGQ